MTKKIVIILPVFLLLLSGCSWSQVEPLKTKIWSAFQPQTQPVLASPSPTPWIEAGGVQVSGVWLKPTLSVVKNLSLLPTHTRLTQLIASADLTTALNGPGPFTFFAPTDEAFNKLPKGMIDSLLWPNRQADLKSVVTFHVVPGKYTQADFKDGLKLTTVQGQTLVLRRNQGRWTINGAGIMIPDIQSENGYLFVIDTVLVPVLPKPSMSPSPVPTAN